MFCDDDEGTAASDGNSAVILNRVTPEAPGVVGSLT